jgi:hypothetical protein
MSCGPDSTSTVAITFPASGSIRDTEPSTKLDTRRLPNAASANRGESPTSTVSTIRPVAGSILPTASSSSQTTHTESGGPARPSGALQTWIVATTVLMPGSILETDASSEFETQTDPAAAVTSSGTPPTRIVARTDPSAGSMRVTEPRSCTRNSEFTTQMLPNAAVIPMGRPPCERGGGSGASRPPAKRTSSRIARTMARRCRMRPRAPMQRSPPQSRFVVPSSDRCTRRESGSVVATARAAHATLPRRQPACRDRSPCGPAHRERRRSR